MVPISYERTESFQGDNSNTKGVGESGDLGLGAGRANRALAEGSLRFDKRFQGCFKELREPSVPFAFD
jgi:hypothetical protein